MRGGGSDKGKTCKGLKIILTLNAQEKRMWCKAFELINRRAITPFFYKGGERGWVLVIVKPQRGGTGP